jgi:hypothetical protein
MKQFAGNKAPADGAGGASGGGAVAIPEFEARPLQLNPDARYHPIPQSIKPMWSAGVPLDISLYISPSPILPPLKSMPKDSLIVNEKGITLGDWGDERSIDTVISVPQEVQNNGTLFAHIFVAKEGGIMDPSQAGYDSTKAYNFVRPLTQYLKKKKVYKVRNLLSADEAADKKPEHEMEIEAGPTIASHYHSNFSLSFIPDSGVLGFQTIHPSIREFVQLERTGARDPTGQHGWYYPTVFVNTFWQLRDHMTELNSTVKELPMHIKVNNMKNWKFTLMASVDGNVKETARKAAEGQVGMGGDGSEFEEVKRVILESNIYLLSTTVVVGVLHTIFEMLAFKNDVSHWRKKKDNVGTSVRTILANVIMQTIIFLYLLDNNENTSWMILFGQGTGIVIEAWKITKSVNVRVRPTPPGSWLPYSIVFEDKHKLSETEKKTKEYDEIAFKYLYIVAVPLLIAYAIYSLMYESHKSWYSFIITTLVGSVYAYGFLMMVPSLYINYRLKSVAHMPGKAMMYKFLNTFIDDLFAFTIKMPTLHRLATLRDDVIFFIYLYQSWKYKIDYSRVNEFGQGGESDDEAEEKKDEAKLIEDAPKESEAKAVKASGAESKGATKRK